MTRTFPGSHPLPTPAAQTALVPAYDAGPVPLYVGAEAPFRWTTARAMALYRSELSDRTRQVRGWRKVGWNMPWPSSESRFRR